MINYIIYEIDQNHLERKKLDYGESSERICFLKTKGLDTFHNTEESAIKEIERNGKNYKEYIIIKRFYKTNYEN